MDTQCSKKKKITSQGFYHSSLMGEKQWGRAGLGVMGERLSQVECNLYQQMSCFFCSLLYKPVPATPSP